MDEFIKPEDVDFATWLRLELARRNLTKMQFAELAGLQRSHVSRVMLGQTAPTLKFCEGVARAFQIPEIEVLAVAGIMRGDSLTDKILRLLPWVTQQEKARILAYLEAAVNRRRRPGKRGG